MNEQMNEIIYVFHCYFVRHYYNILWILAEPQYLSMSDHEGLINFIYVC